MPGIRFDRVLQLTLHSIFLRSIPGSEGLLLNNDDDSLPIQEAQVDLSEWFIAANVENRGNFAMLLTLVAGLVAGGVLAALEVYYSKHDNFFLSVELSYRPAADIVTFYLLTGPSLLGGLVGVLLLPAYRPPIVFFSIVPFVVTLSLAIAGQSVIGGMAFVLLASNTGILMGWLLGFRKTPEDDFAP